VFSARKAYYVALHLGNGPSLIAGVDVAAYSAGQEAADQALLFVHGNSSSMQAFERHGRELLLRKFCLLGYRRYWGNFVSEAGGFPLELLDLQLPVLMRNSRGGALSQQLSRAGIRHIPLLDRLARSICEVISKRCFGRIVGKPEPTIFASSNFRLAQNVHRGNLYAIAARSFGDEVELVLV
jgi:hypothetical protein